MYNDLSFVTGFAANIGGNVVWCGCCTVWTTMHGM